MILYPNLLVTSDDMSNVKQVKSATNEVNAIVNHAHIGRVIGPEEYSLQNKNILTKSGFGVQNLTRIALLKTKNGREMIHYFSGIQCMVGNKLQYVKPKNEMIIHLGCALKSECRFLAILKVKSENVQRVYNELLFKKRMEHVTGVLRKL